MKPVDEMGAGEVGYVIANIKELSDVTIGETLPTTTPRPKSRCPDTNPDADGLFRLLSRRHDRLSQLRAAFEKLALNDASFSYTPQNSPAALGFGFRCGFLGLLHMEIIRERLERESDIDVDADGPDGQL